MGIQTFPSRNVAERCLIDRYDLASAGPELSSVSDVDRDADGIAVTLAEYQRSRSV